MGQLVQVPACSGTGDQPEHRLETRAPGRQTSPPPSLPTTTTSIGTHARARRHTRTHAPARHKGQCTHMRTATACTNHTRHREPVQRKASSTRAALPRLGVCRQSGFAQGWSATQQLPGLVPAGPWGAGPHTRSPELRTVLLCTHRAPALLAQLDGEDKQWVLQVDLAGPSLQPPHPGQPLPNPSRKGSGGGCCPPGCASDGLACVPFGTHVCRSLSCYRWGHVDRALVVFPWAGKPSSTHRQRRLKRRSHRLLAYRGRGML